MGFSFDDAYPARREFCSGKVYEILTAATPRALSKSEWEKWRRPEQAVGPARNAEMAEAALARIAHGVSSCRHRPGAARPAGAR
jgi:hypothetical protein